jgi:hexosaminidase
MYRRLDIIDRRLEEIGLTQRKNQRMMLRRLAGSDDIAPLLTLVSIIEPVKEYKRYQVRPQTMLSPLTGLIDAAQPDAPGARAFNRAVDDMLAGINRAENAAKIRAMINDWQAAEPGLRDIMVNSPALAEARQLPADLHDLNQIAAEAIGSLNSNTVRDAAWRDSRLKSLDAIAKQKAGVEFVVLSGIRKLVNAASGGQKGS